MQTRKKQTHKKIRDTVQQKATEIIKRHEIKKEPLCVKELTFRHGRADIVIYGLIEDVSVLPIGVEVLTGADSATDLYQQIEKIRITYDYAFSHIYIAFPPFKRQKVYDLAKILLSQISYGLLTVEDGIVKMEVEAKTRRPKDNVDHSEIASRGILYIAFKEVIEKEGFKVDNISSGWIGFKKPINYCSWIHKDKAAFGIYAQRENNALNLVNYILQNNIDTEKLANNKVNVYLEIKHKAGRPITGYTQILDEPINKEILKEIKRKIKTLKTAYKAPIGLGIYKPIWDIKHPPSYTYAKKQIEKCMQNDEFGQFIKLIKTQPPKKR